VFVSGSHEISEDVGFIGAVVLSSDAANMKIVLPPPSLPSFPYLAHTVGLE